MSESNPPTPQEILAAVQDAASLRRSVTVRLVEADTFSGIAADAGGGPTIASLESFGLTNQQIRRNAIALIDRAVELARRSVH